MRTLEDTITAENTAVHPYLARINSLLHNAVLTCKAAMSLDSSDVVGFKGVNIAANKNLDHQWTFKRQQRHQGGRERSCLLVSVYISNKPVTQVLCTYYHYSHATDKERSKILEELGNSSASQ